MTAPAFDLGTTSFESGRIRGDVVLGAIGLKLLKLKLTLFDQARATLGCLTIGLAPEPRDLQLQALDQNGCRGETRF